MKVSLFKKINIFLKVNELTIDSYFNQHDPAPIYKRQLSHEFEQYIMNYSITIKRYSNVTYKLILENNSDKLFADPLIHAIRRHFSLKKSIAEAEFKKFKRRSCQLLMISFSVLVLCLGVLPAFVPQEHGMLGVLKEALHLLSWVMMWKPTEKLIFYWNPHLKEISILDKLTNAEVLIIDNVKTLSVENAA
jgi:hypothetical protein